MKQILLICAVVGCGGKSGPANIADPILEKAIRKSLKQPKSELTKADYEEVTSLELNNNQLTNVKGLEKLTQLKVLHLYYNKLTSVKGLEKLTQLNRLILNDNNLTKAQIEELQKALPKCKNLQQPLTPLLLPPHH